MQVQRVLIVVTLEINFLRFLCECRADGETRFVDNATRLERHSIGPTFLFFVYCGRERERRECA